MSYDRSWLLTRGHTSQIGLGCVVDLLTGLVIDAHVMSTYCQVCKNIAALKTEEECKKQEEEIHVGSGKCSANFYGMFHMYIVLEDVGLYHRHSIQRPSTGSDL